jgi:hypothetical protein
VFLHGDFRPAALQSRAGVALPDQPTLIVHPHGLAGDAVPGDDQAMAADRISWCDGCPTGPPRDRRSLQRALVAFESAQPSPRATCSRSC